MDEDIQPHAVSDCSELGMVEHFLNSLRSLRGRFVQIESSGHIVEGAIYIKRPGRLRIEYDKPSPLLWIADGFSLIYIDRQLGQVERQPLSSVPVGILTGDAIRLCDGDFTVTRVVKEEHELAISLVHAANPTAGAITLFFGYGPFRLKKWTFTDSQRSRVDVLLRNVELNVQLDDALFRFEQEN